MTCFCAKLVTFKEEKKTRISNFLRSFFCLNSKNLPLPLRPSELNVSYLDANYYTSDNNNLIIKLLDQVQFVVQHCWYRMLPGSWDYHKSCWIQQHKYSPKS